MCEIVEVGDGHVQRDASKQIVGSVTICKLNLSNTKFFLIILKTVRFHLTENIRFSEGRPTFNDA
jgi:hypothetical protein